MAATTAWNEGAVLIVVEGYSAAGRAAETKDALQAVVAAIIP
jgi:hypothetical protein